LKWLAYIKKIPDTVRESRSYRRVRIAAKQIFIPGFERVPLYDVAKFFLRQVNRVGLNQRAAAISYSILLAIPAILILIFTLIPYFPDSIKNDIAKQINDLARSISPTPSTEKWVTGFIKDFVKTSRSGLLSTGLFFVALASSNAILGVMSSFNASITELRKRNFLQIRFTAIKITAVLFFALFVTVFFLIYEDYLLRQFLSKREFKGAFWKNVVAYLRWFHILVFVVFSVGLIYKYAPQQTVRWRWMSPGTIMATVLTVLTYVLFSWYLNHFARYNEIYGSVGTVIILMLLIYFNALMLLIGFELNVAIYEVKKRQPASLKTNENEVINIIDDTKETQNAISEEIM
jgi:membrane protein